jgi:hypothetical protein
MATANSGFKIAQVKKKGKGKEKVARTQKTLLHRAFKRGEDRLNNKSRYDIESKLPSVKRVALFNGQRPLNKGSTKVLMFPFATPCEAWGFQSKQCIFTINLSS